MVSGQSGFSPRFNFSPSERDQSPMRHEHQVNRSWKQHRELFFTVSICATKKHSGEKYSDFNIKQNLVFLQIVREYTSLAVDPLAGCYGSSDY